MIYKHMFLSVTLVACSAGTIRAAGEAQPNEVDALNTEVNYTTEEFEASLEAMATIFADAITETSKIASNRMIEISKLSADKNIESAESLGLEVTKTAADAMVEIARITAETRIEAAKIAAEKLVEASEKYGLEAAKIDAQKKIDAANILAPIAGVTVSIVGILAIASLFR